MSSRRKPGSMDGGYAWIPAFAGMTCISNTEDTEDTEEMQEVFVPSVLSVLSVVHPAGVHAHTSVPDTFQETQVRFLPVRLASYKAWSARSSASSMRSPSLYAVTPAEKVTKT